MTKLEEAIAKAAAAGKDQVFKTGTNINWGAIYDFTIKDVKLFESTKSDAQVVFEFEVTGVTPTLPQEVFEKSGKFPNQVGTTCSTALDTTKKVGGKPGYLMGIVLGYLEDITGWAVKDLVEVKDGRVAFMELMRVDKAPEPSPLAGLKVRCEAKEGPPTRDRTFSITKLTFQKAKAPEGHPFADLIK